MNAQALAAIVIIHLALGFTSIGFARLSDTPANTIACLESREAAGSKIAGTPCRMTVAQFMAATPLKPLTTLTFSVRNPLQLVEFAWDLVTLVWGLFALDYAVLEYEGAPVLAQVAVWIFKVFMGVVQFAIILQAMGVIQRFVPFGLGGRR